MVISYPVLAAVVAAPPALALAVSDSTWTAFFVSLPATIASIATVIVAVKASKQVQKIEVATNSIKDALVKSTADEALARGIKQGTIEEKARQGEQALAHAAGAAKGAAQEQVKQSEILLAKTQAKTPKKVEEL